MRILMLCFLAMLCTTTAAQTITVTSSSSVGPGTLSEVLATAPSGSTVGFSPNVAGIIDLPNPVDINLGSREITILGNVDLAGVPTVTLSGMGNGRMLRTLANLTVINMNFTGGLAAGESGGAILSNGGVLTLINCHFVNCRVSGIGSGGAVSAEKAVIQDCTFTGCTAEYRGGAIYAVELLCERSVFENGSATVGGAFVWSQDAEIVDCTFTLGTAPGTTSRGGAVHAVDLAATRCTFDRNSAINGGAVHADRGMLRACEFIENTATTGRGGAVHATRVDCVDCRFHANRAGTAMGGALFGTLVTAADSVFSGNTSRRGGAVAASNLSVFEALRCRFVENAATFDGGAIFSENSRVTSVESVFIANEAGSGGAIFVEEMFTAATLMLESSTFVQNSATNVGGAVLVQGQSISCINCTFSNNTATLGGGALNITTSITTILNSTFSMNGSAFGRSIAYGSTTLAVENSIFEDNGTGSMFADRGSSTVRSDGFNICTADLASVPWMNATGDQVATAPLLNPLADNGGNVPTMAPMPASPAINQGGPGSSATDARGITRPTITPGVPLPTGGNGSDIGAFEHALNQPPVITAPAAFNHIWTSTSPPAFTGANVIRIDDPDAGSNPIRVTLSVTSATLTLAATTGLTFTQGSGTNDQAMDFTGSQHDINRALNGMTYNGAGADTLIISVDDQGHTGSGGPQTANAQVNIQVTAPEIELLIGTTPFPSGATDQLGQVLIGPQTRTYTIHNPGTADLNIDTIRFFNVLNCTVTVTSPPPAAIGPSQSAQFTLEVQPDTFGQFGVEAVLITSAPGSPNYVILIDGVVSQPFGEITRGSTLIQNNATDQQPFLPTAGYTLTYVITNVGNDDMIISLVTVDQLVNVTLNIVQMPAGTVVSLDHTELTIEVLPAAPGSYSFDVILQTNVPGQSPYEFTVEGVAGDPDLELTRDAVPIPADGIDQFPPVIQAPFQLVYEVENTGNFTLELGPVLIENELNGLFAITTQLPSSVAPTATAQFVLSVQPAALGPLSVEMHFAHNIHGMADFRFTLSSNISEARMEVRRNGANVPDNTVIQIGTTQITPTDITLDIQNTGNIPLIIDPVQTLNLVNCSVSIAPAPPLGIAPTMTLQVTFTITPTDLGPYSLDIVMQSTAINLPVFSLRLEGQASESRIEVERGGVVIASGASDDLGIHPQDPFNASWLVRNTGNRFLSISNVQINAPVGCTVTVSNPLPAFVDVGLTAPLGLEITPNVTGLFSFELQISNGSTNHPVFLIQVRGNTGHPAISVQFDNAPVTNGSELAFRHEGDPHRMTFTIQNVGARELELGTVSFSNLESAEAAVIGPMASVISMGASALLIVEVTPTNRNVSVTMSIPTTDPANDPFVVTLKGTRPSDSSSKDDNGCKAGQTPGHQAWLLLLTLALLTATASQRKRRMANSQTTT
jgi:predicted outer membrane repeat protein